MTALADLTTEQLGQEIKGWLDVGEPAHSLVDELVRRATPADEEPITVLPVPVTDRIRELFGGGKRTFDAISRRCKFALQVWGGKYGPLTPEQHEYAVSVLLWALQVPDNHPNKRAAAYERLDRVVHHERTHAGFKQREGELVDVSRELAEL